MNTITIKNLLVSALLAVSFGAYSQAEVELPIEEQFEVLAMEWFDKSELLKTYVGLNEYCQSPVFRKSVDRTLSTIHSYDSLILAKMQDPSSYLAWNKKEEKKTLSDVSELERVYEMHAFVEHMREACVFRNEIESNADELRNGVGYESYDSKVLLIETDMNRYFSKIDKLVRKIDDHLHVLHIDY